MDLFSITFRCPRLVGAFKAVELLWIRVQVHANGFDADSPGG